MSSESNQLVVVIGPFGSEARRTELCESLAKEAPNTTIDYTALLQQSNTNTNGSLTIEQILGKPCQQTVVLNGFPRTKVQADELVRLQHRWGAVLLFVVVHPPTVDAQEQLTRWIAEHFMFTDADRDRIERAMADTFYEVVRTLWMGGRAGLVLSADLPMEMALKQTLSLLDS